jgi:hypothetical protein
VGGEFFLSQIFKIESPPLKEQKLNGDPPLPIRIFFCYSPHPPFSFLLVKWRFPGVIVLLIIK